MRVIPKITILFVLIQLSVKDSMAQNQLAKLPFDIIVSSTTNRDLDGKGICVVKAKGADSLLHCARYSMSDNKFYVYMNPEEIVYKVSFLSVSHHTLPDNWKNLGLHIATTYRYRKMKAMVDASGKLIDNEGGNSPQEYLDIITANGAQNITRKTTYASDYQQGEIISFTIGKFRYDAEFIKWIRPKWCVDCPTYTDYDNGLVSIEVIEAY